MLPERAVAARAVIDAARARLAAAGLWSEAPVVVLDAPIGAAVALSVADAASAGLRAYAGRPAILFQEAPTEPELDVVVHELTHVWLRARGWNPPRWVLAGGRANHESAVVHEGVADFVAAALTGDPLVGDGLGEPSAVRDLRAAARCPDDLVGAPYADAAVVSSALWELSGAGGEPADLAAVLDAVRAVGPEHTERVATWVGAVSARLAAEAPRLAMRWAELAEARGLRRCGDAAAVDGAGGRERVAAGTRRFGVDAVEGPLRFRAEVPGAAVLRVSGTGGGAGLALGWRAEDAGRGVVASGSAPLDAGPGWVVAIATPAGTAAVELAVVSTRSDDAPYTLTGVASVGAPSPVGPSPRPAGGSGCATGAGVGGLEAALVGALLWRRWRGRRAAACFSGR
ncbi:MAG: hypothetical protein H6745_32355 [Deltaproteobacteria bacterium]|nr:hypothetical protein [Deltaproteobacteria bacterium]